MQVTKTTRTSVSKCPECPWFTSSMDGPTCPKMYEKYGAYNDFVFPEGREKIHPKCPLKS